MRIYLVRHGEAVLEAVDPLKPLSEKGRKEVKRTADFLEGIGVRCPLFIHSGKKRAEQTAQILQQTLNPQAKMIAKEFLGPLDRVDPIYQEISQMSEDFILVGHMPFLGKLAAKFITGREEDEIAVFKTAGVAALEKSSTHGWQLVFFINQDDIKTHANP